MKIYINDIPVNIVSIYSSVGRGKFDGKFDARKNKISEKSLKGHVKIEQASESTIEKVLEIMTDNKLGQLDSITFGNVSNREIIKYLFSKFSVVRAGGGVVEKDSKILMIHRLGKWDLPKGKLNIRETIKECAVREVEEETGVKCKLNSIICHTWHTYTDYRKYIIKKTIWYQMSCINDDHLSPQKEENIKVVKWMDHESVKKALKNSYGTISYIYDSYMKMKRVF